MTEDSAVQSSFDERPIDNIAEVVEYDDASNGRQELLAPDKLTEIEEAVSLSLQSVGIEYLRVLEDYLVFRLDGSKFQDESPFSERAIPRSSVPGLAKQLGNAISEHPTIRGLVIPSSGYSELLLRSYGRLPSMYSFENALRLQRDAGSCSHDQSDNELPAIPFQPSQARGRDVINPRLHLASPSSPCIEMSNASPLAMLLYGRSPIRPLRPRSLLVPTVKVTFGTSMDEDALIKATDNLVRALLYELDVRNGVVIGTFTRPLSREVMSRGRIRSARTDTARYPDIRIQHEVSDLFNFASQALDNLPLAFLSYYQTLEYFMPAAVRQSALKKIRRELRDPMFDRDSDTSLLRILSATERAVNISEAGQLQTLVNDYARKDRMEEFFQLDWGNHFTKRGPIKGVDAINIHETAGLANRIANRIYQIRNRIVHAKDDPKYAETPVLLPRSQEADALRPDIELVRLIATEAILAGQGS